MKSLVLDSGDCLFGSFYDARFSEPFPVGARSPSLLHFFIVFNHILALSTADKKSRGMDMPNNASLFIKNLKR